MTLRVLFIAYAVPPSADVGVNRAVSFCKYLPEFGIETVVSTVDSHFYSRQDSSISLPATVRVIRTAQDSTLLDWYKRWKSSKEPIANSKSVREAAAPATSAKSSIGVKEHILSTLTIPDLYRGWRGPAIKVGLQLLQNEKFDAILSTSPPSTDHQVGLALKRKSGIPWIADFRDPWVTEPSDRNESPRWRQRLDLKLERDCVESADLVLCNTDQFRDTMKSRYPALPSKQFETLTNGFDDVVAPADLKLGKQRPLRCLHLGGIYGSRRIDTFCEAIGSLVANGRLNPEEIKISFVGHVDGSQRVACEKIAGNLIERGVIEFLSPVSKQEATKLLWGADLLLVFQGAYQLQVPLKFYEYLATGKPMFAVAQPGALTDLMTKTRTGIWAEEDNQTQIAERFLAAMDIPAQPPEHIQETWGREFHFRSLTQKLAGWVDSVAARRRSK
jgi:Glycosyl transferase 4-like domain/Glycosyl transferases group 1